MSAGSIEAGHEAKPRTRVAFINTHPIQYFAPFYAYLDRTPDIEPVALYLTDFSLRGEVDRQFGREIVWDVDLLSGYEHHFVGRDWKSATPYGFWSLRGDGLWRALKRGRFDLLVLHGHSPLANLVALAAARFDRIPVLYKADTHLLLDRTGLRSTLRPLALRSHFSQIDGFLAVGSRNHDFYRSFGISEARIWPCPFAVDNARLLQAAALSPRERSAKRAELGLSPDRPAAVYASKLSARKRPDDLIGAGQSLARQGFDLDILIVGTGEMEQELRALALAQPGLRVHFAGFRNQNELPAVLAASDVFVLPAKDEPFGLIVNEAMCAGLPIVVSREIGCAPDLVMEAENGFTFDAGDVPGLADALRKVLADDSQRIAMGAKSREIITGWSYAEDLAGLRAAIAALKR